MLARHFLHCVATVMVLGAMAGAARASSGVPSPLTSIVPHCFFAAPDNLNAAAVVVRDIANNAVAGSKVEIAYGSCAATNTCQDACTGCIVDWAAHRVYGFTNASGVAAFDLRLGGMCANEHVSVIADGVVLANVPIASLDQTGDLLVTEADVAVVQGLVGTNDTSADFDCNGLVESADLAQVQLRLHTNCIWIDPVQHSTWGQLKSIYR
jgi:hypothetical protein